MNKFKLKSSDITKVSDIIEKALIRAETDKSKYTHQHAVYTYTDSGWTLMEGPFKGITKEQPVMTAHFEGGSYMAVVFMLKYKIVGLSSDVDISDDKQPVLIMPMEAFINNAAQVLTDKDQYMDMLQEAINSHHVDTTDGLSIQVMDADIPKAESPVFTGTPIDA